MFLSALDRLTAQTVRSVLITLMLQWAEYVMFNSDLTITALCVQC